MATFSFKKAVAEQSTTIGTGTFTLNGDAVSGNRTFTSAFGGNVVVFYRIDHANGSEWENGYGTFTNSGTTLSRTTISASSNSNNAVNFSSGIKNVYLVMPEEVLTCGDSTAILWNNLACGRLTLTSGAPISFSDAGSTIYYTPYNGDLISLYDNVMWKPYRFTELSKAIGTLTNGKNYDVFIDAIAGSPVLSLGSAWTNNTTRADALTILNGIYVLNSDNRYRYLGTFRTNSTTTTINSNAHRFVWNMYNRVIGELSAQDGTDSWTYTTASWRQAENSSNNQVDYICGFAENIVSAQVLVMVGNVSVANVAVGIGVDSITSNSAQLYGSNAPGVAQEASCFYYGNPGIGYHYLAWLEISSATGTTTWYGDNGIGFWNHGLLAWVYF